MTSAERPVIAVFNSSDDTVDLLRTALEHELKKGELDLLSFIEQHGPRVIVYDISPPYEPNWAFLRLVRSSHAARGRHFVITTTNKSALDGLVGSTESLEIIGKPYDLSRVIAAVRAAVGATTPR